MEMLVSNNQNTGWYDLEVYDQNTSQWIMLNNAFEIFQPTMTQYSPNNGDPGQTLSVSISGSNMNYGNQWSGTLSSFRFSQVEWNQYVLWKSNKYIWKLFIWKC